MLTAWHNSSSPDHFDKFEIPSCSMKFCYCDETGTGSEPFAVMVGVIVDSQRMHLTKDHWSELLARLSSTVGSNIEELHTRDFYSGNGVWRCLKGIARAKIITDVCTWLAERKHHLVYTALNKAEFRKQLAAGKIPPEIQTTWRFMGFHLMLAVQKALQNKHGTKGNTLFIFDNENREEKKFANLIASPPAWSDAYYKKDKKQRRLDQIVDVPYFGDSKEVALIQLADFLAYFLRRYIEIREEAVPPRYPGEDERIETWTDAIKKRLISLSSIYPQHGRCDVSDMFFKLAPQSALLMPGS